MSDRGWIGWVRYGLPGLAVGLVLAWFLGNRGPVVLAQGPAGTSIPLPMPVGERTRANVPAGTQAEGMGGGTIALTSSIGGSAQLLFLIDTRSRAFAVYRIDPANPKGTVKLEAARQYQWDLKLAEYNNQAPEVAAIESTVRSLGPPNR